MTPRTDELSRVLRATAEDVLQRGQVPGPDARALWQRGRRTAMASRAAGAGLAALVVLLVTAVALVMRTAPVAVPADGATMTYPELVSELFPGQAPPGAGPVFGLVAVPVEGPGPPETFVIDRSGLLTKPPSWTRSAIGVTLDPEGDGVVLAPDGRTGFVPEGVVDLTTGSLARLMAADRVAQAPTGFRGVWSPDSRHLLIPTVDGAAVLDRFANVVTTPAADDPAVVPAGWRDATTLLGVRPTAEAGRPALAIVTRGLTDQDWTTVGRVDAGAADGRVSPGAVHASPDGTRLLLVYPASNGSDAEGVLVDARSGQPVAFTAGGPSTLAGWGPCTPVWQGDQPLTASGGLRRPGDGASVMRFSGRLELGCVTLPGNSLTGSPDPRSAGAVREQVWRVAVPVGGALALIVAVWVVVALRRSRRHGERFLPMIYVQRF